MSMHDKANKHRRTRGMPRHRTATKDAGSGETLVRTCRRGGVLVKSSKSRASTWPGL